MDTKNLRREFELALEQQYCGILFDYDGTLTQRYEQDIPQDLIKQALALNMQGVMMGICTARPFHSALPRLEPFLQAADDPQKIREKWVIICENGCKGYFFNSKTQDYEEFYRAEWPREVDREALYERLKQEFGEASTLILNNTVSFEVFHKSEPDLEKNDVSLLLRPHGREEMGPKEWEAASHKIHLKVIEIIKEFGAEDFLHIGDSKMGVSILPSKGDKDTGIEEFAKFLAHKYDLQIPPPFKQIVSVGDQAAPGGNDFHFLKGEKGTPFNVGEEENGGTALRVFDEKGQILYGPAGTLEILRKLKMLN